MTSIRSSSAQVLLVFEPKSKRTCSIKQLSFSFHSSLYRSVSRSAPQPPKSILPLLGRLARLAAAPPTKAASSWILIGVGYTMSVDTPTATPATPGTRRTALTVSLAQRTALWMVQHTRIPTVSPPLEVHSLLISSQTALRRTSVPVFI